jgi:Tfp pilus assembly protein PilW
MIGVYKFLDSNKRDYVAITDLATAQSEGRIALDIFSGEAMVAGYNPLGAPFNAVPQGTASSVRFLADLDKDGDVTSDTEVDENITYEFVDTDGDGLYTLRRGIDLDGDGYFISTGESVDTIATNIVQVDTDGDSVAESFLAYDAAPPDTTRIWIVFGIRTKHYNIVKKRYDVVRFQNHILLRNRI